ncbi:hypothetical protein ACFV23_36685, partial [Streptomyces sp. NPDC059627]
MGEDSRARPEAFEVAEGLWLHAYQTLAARLPASEPPPRARAGRPARRAGRPRPPARPPPPAPGDGPARAR